MKYLIFLCSIFIMSCSLQKSVLSDYNSEGFNITSLKGSSIRLYVYPVIDIGEFRKPFENEYTSNSNFCSFLTNNLKEKISKYSTISTDSDVSLNVLFLNPSISDNNTTKVNGVLEQLHENYLLGIKRVIISKDVKQNPQTIETNTTVNTSRNRTAGGGRTNELKKVDACVIKLVAEVWSVKEKKRVAEFTSIGESKIVLMAYGRALNEALESSVSNIADYIEEGK